MDDFKSLDVEIGLIEAIEEQTPAAPASSSFAAMMRQAGERLRELDRDRHFDRLADALDEFEKLGLHFSGVWLRSVARA